MVKNNLIFESIIKNKNLSPEVKENFNELIKIYLTYYPEVDIETLANNLESLQVEQVNKYLIDGPVKYNNNKLLIKTNDFEKNYDYRHLLMREIIKMQSYKDVSKKQKNSQYDAIYEGYSSLCANYMVGNEGDVNLYEDEMIGVNLIGKIVGVEALDNLIIHNDDGVLLEKLQSQNININDFQKLTSKMNYNMKARNIDRNNSMLSKIQLDLIKMFMKKNRSIEEIENFKYNSYTNLNVFDEKNKYKDLNEVYKTYERIIDNFQVEHLTSKTR